MQFNMNACLLKSNLTCQNSKFTTDDNAMGDEQMATENDAASMLRKDRICCSPDNGKPQREIYHLERSEMSEAAQSEAADTVYSVSNHYKKAAAKKKNTQASGKRNLSKEQKNKGEKRGTSKETHSR